MPSLCPKLWPLGSSPTTAAPPRHPHLSRRWPSPNRTEDDGSHVPVLLLCDRVRPPLMPVRLTHNRRRGPMAHSPEARGVHPHRWAFGATLRYSRYTSSPTIPIIHGRLRFRTRHRGFLHVAIPVSGRRTLKSRWDRLRFPLSPWASDDFFLLVRRLPGWPQAMWGHRLLLLRDQRVRRLATHASWRNVVYRN
jgi:hypothetical protein